MSSNIIEIDFSAAELFLSYMDNKVNIDEVWDHDAYKIIRKHAEKLRGGLKKEQIVRAVRGEKSGYYGVSDVKEDRENIEELMDFIKEKEDSWLKVMETELNRVVPHEDWDITIYPVFGYDIGIGLEDGVCVNLNEWLFFKDPRQFLYLAIHECTHTLYSRIHGLPDIEDMETKEDRISFFNTFIQTEGYAVYTPLKLRRKDGYTGSEEHYITADYYVISDDERMRKVVKDHDELREDLDNSENWSLQEYMNRAFGEKRFSYRVGCGMVNRIEQEKGMDEVRKAFYMDADEFVERYDRLLDAYR